MTDQEFSELVQMANANYWAQIDEEKYELDKEAKERGISYEELMKEKDYKFLSKE